MKAAGTAREWWRETHGRVFELVRFFLAHIFDTEMSASAQAWRPVAVSALALAMPAALVLLDPPYAGKGLERITAVALLRAGEIADQFAVLTFVFALTGILAVLVWQSLVPSRRDHLLLAGLPVTPRQIFFARFFSMLLFGAGLVTAINLTPAILPPHRFTAAWDTGGFMARFEPACLGCSTVFFGIVAIQGALVNAVPGRWLMRISTYVQALLICGLFVAGLSSWLIVERGPAVLSISQRILLASPSFWFACLHRTMLGDADPLTVALAQRAWITGAGAPVAAALLYLLAYGRNRKLMIETQEGAVVAGRSSRLIGWLARTPREEAVMRFMAATLARSRTHRLCVLAWLGGAIGIMLHAVLILGGTFGGPVNAHRILQFVVLYWPIGISVVMIYGIRHAYSMPSHAGASWLFRATEQEGRRDWMRGVERFTRICVILPIFAVLTPLGIAVMGWAIGIRMALLEWLIALAIFDVLFHDWQKLPFTCSWQPGSRPLVIVLAAWIAVLGMVVPVLSIIVAAASQMPEIFAIYGAVLLAIRLWLKYQRRAGWGEAPLIYEDDADAVADLGIRDMRIDAASPCRPA